MEQKTLEIIAVKLTSEADVFRPEAADGLTPEQWRAAAMIVAGQKNVDIARELGANPETVSRWKSDSTFAAAATMEIRTNFDAVTAEVRFVSLAALVVVRE